MICEGFFHGNICISLQQYCISSVSVSLFKYINKDKKLKKYVIAESKSKCDRGEILSKQLWVSVPAEKLGHVDYFLTHSTQWRVLVVLVS